MSFSPWLFWGGLFFFLFGLVLGCGSGFFGGFFWAEEAVNADVCNDFIVLSGRDIVGSAVYGFFGWDGQGLFFSLDFFLAASIETKNY